MSHFTPITTSEPAPASAPTPSLALAASLSGARLDFSRCLRDAGVVYRRNFFRLVGAGVMTTLISVVTLGVLAGPLCGGWSLLAMNALSRPDREVDLGLLYTGSYRLGALAVVFLLTTVSQVAGTVLFILPGLLILTLFLFPYHLVMDKGIGPLEALAASARIVWVRGLGPNFMLATLVFLLNIVPALIPYGWPLAWVLSPLGWLILSSAYLQEVREAEHELADVLPRGFPVAAVPRAGTDASEQTAAGRA